MLRTVRHWMLTRARRRAALPATARAADVPALPQHLRDTGLYVAGISACWPSRLSTRCGRMAPQSVAGSGYRPARASTPRSPTPGISRAARNCGRNSATAARSRRASSNAPRMATGASQLRLDGGWHGRRARAGGRHSRDAGARGARTRVTPFPPQDDCRACHEGAPVPVLGFGALQLSPDRDPLAPHAESNGRGGESALARGSWPAAQSVAGAAGESAANQGGDARRTRRPRLPAWQLRPLSQR